MKETLLNNLELKDVATETGQVAFYYSSFNNEDLGGDIVLPGAFKKTVKDNFKHIYHNRDHSQSVGAPKSFEEDKKGAFVVSQLGVKTICGSDCFEQYKAGMVKGHSMEYVATKREYNEETYTRTIKEATLWGVTTVTEIPMNLNTPTISLKTYEDIEDQLQKISKFLKTANISDECGNKFLKWYDSLCEKAKELKEKFNPIIPERKNSFYLNL